MWVYSFEHFQPPSFSIQVQNVDKQDKQDKSKYAKFNLVLQSVVVFLGDIMFLMMPNKTKNIDT